VKKMRCGLIEISLVVRKRDNLKIMEKIGGWKMKH